MSAAHASRSHGPDHDLPVHGLSDGLTLIAVLAVIVILLALAAVVLSRADGAHTKSVDTNTPKAAVIAACAADLDALRMSIASVQIHEGSYPKDAAALVDPNKGGLLRQYPTSPDYRFTYPGTGGPPHVDVSGPGLQPATDRCVP